MNTDPVVRPVPTTTPAPEVSVDPPQDPPSSEAFPPEAQFGDKSSYVWTRGENEYASRGRVSDQALQGVPRFSFGLTSRDIRVKGAGTFRTGRRPNSDHPAGTANHDAFDQAVLYSGMRDIARQYEALIGKSFASLVRSPGKRERANGVANSMPDVNAYYSRQSEEVHFGTSDGKWDLAADKDVVKHEMGHYVLDHLAPNVMGPLHEGFGDAQATLSQGDPELSEDFGKVTGTAGAPLRNANNDRTVANTTPQVHDRGRVYAGFFWEIGEHLHTSLTGRARNRATDAQLLDRRAADHALRILWTFPLYLGTTFPDGPTVVRSVHRAIDTLATAGKLRGVRVDALRQFVDAEARRRGLVAATPSDARDPGAPAPLESQDRQAALDEAVSLAGLDPNTARLERVSVLTGPLGETVERFRVSIPLPVEPTGELRATVADELITLITSPGGRMEAQVGRIPHMSEAFRRESMPALDPEALLESQISLVERAREELTRLTASEGPADTAADHPHMAARALDVLGRTDSPTPQLVWHEGAPVLRLSLDTLVFEGILTPTGALDRVQRESGVVCGPEGFSAGQ